MKRRVGKRLKKARDFADSLPSVPKEKVPFVWHGIHHGYLGVWLTAFACFFLYMNHNNQLDWLNWFYLSLAMTGLFILMDDVYEHLVDVSPLRRLWLWMLSKQTWW